MVDHIAMLSRPTPTCSSYCEMGAKQNITILQLHRFIVGGSSLTAGSWGFQKGRMGQMAEQVERYLFNGNSGTSEDTSATGSETNPARKIPATVFGTG
jgi:hypothetical protein